MGQQTKVPLYGILRITTSVMKVFGVEMLVIAKQPYVFFFKENGALLIVEDTVFLSLSCAGGATYKGELNDDKDSWYTWIVLTKTGS